MAVTTDDGVSYLHEALSVPDLATGVDDFFVLSEALATA